MKIATSDSGNDLLLSLARGIQLGATNFWRNKFLSIATALVIAVILFIFNTIIAVHFISNQALQVLSQHVDMVIYLKDDINFFEAQNLVQMLQKNNSIKSVTYTSKEDALALMSKTHPETAEFLQKYLQANPLPPSISITLEKPEDYSKIATLFNQDPIKSLMKNAVNPGSSNESIVMSKVAQNLANIQQFIRQIIFWIVLVFVLGGTLVIINAIQITIYARRHEISIMRLVGATPNFIRLPFIVEGILYSLLAFAVSILFLFFLGKSIQIQDSNLWLLYQNFHLEKVFAGELVLTIVLGLISSFSSVQQYLKGKLTFHA